jgi:CRISPR-associated endonuclease Cas1
VCVGHGSNSLRALQSTALPIPSRASVKPRDGVVTLNGYGILVRVERGHLYMEDGVGNERRSVRFSRVIPDLKRLVVLGHSGLISLDALRWLRDIGTPFIHIDSDGSLITVGASSGLNDARLRRAQALALENGIAIQISRKLIQQKINSQADVLRIIPDSGEAIHDLSQISTNLIQCHSIEELRYAEGRAAKSYWAAWKPIAINFDSKDCDRVPEHWTTFGTRHSLISKPGSRRATNPVNAILNYLYAILEAEARIAALRMGLDPGIGFLHADLPARDSLQCDLMEPIRPKVDAYVLQLLKRKIFRKADFFETREGICRLLPSVSRLLGETAHHWMRELGPVVESVAQMLGLRGRGRNPLPTPLTQANRSAGRNKSPRRAPSINVGASTSERLLGPAPEAVCKKCGVALPVATGPQYCNPCWCHSDCATRGDSYTDAHTLKLKSS